MFVFFQDFFSVIITYFVKNKLNINNFFLKTLSLIHCFKNIKFKFNQKKIILNQSLFVNIIQRKIP